MAAVDVAVVVAALVADAAVLVADAAVLVVDAAALVADAVALVATEVPRVLQQPKRQLLPKSQLKQQKLRFVRRTALLMQGSRLHYLYGTIISRYNSSWPRTLIKRLVLRRGS